MLLPHLGSVVIENVTDAKALRPVYTAATKAAAMERSLEFCEAWGERYPAIVRL